MPQQLEVRTLQQMADVELAAGIKVIDAQHIMALCQQLFAQVRAEKTGATCHEDALAMQFFHGFALLF
jgi:hypothetical protein